MITHLEPDILKCEIKWALGSITMNKASEADDQNDQYHNTPKLYCMSIIVEKRREAKGKREKERYTHLNAEFQRIARRDKKAFLSDQCKAFLSAKK